MGGMMRLPIGLQQAACTKTALKAAYPGAICVGFRPQTEDLPKMSLSPDTF
jgi:hypothetical protein